jgi:hypothetical protein
MRYVLAIIALLGLSLPLSSQSVRIDERASKITLADKTYDVFLVASASKAAPSSAVELQIIDAEGKQLATAYQQAPLKLGPNRLTAAITLFALPANPSDLLWYRLVYRLYDNGQTLAKGILPLFSAVSNFDIHVTAPQSALPGQPFTIRVYARHPIVDRALAGVAITAEINESVRDEPLFSAKSVTDAQGFAVFRASVPESTAGRDVLISVSAQRGNAQATASNELYVGRRARILVQTDKPIYQPGQMLHIRALALTDDDRTLADEKIQLTVRDEDDTIVFRDERTSSRFGVVSADWMIPDRLRLGQYSIEARKGSDDDDSSRPSGRRSVRISRYDLPTFVLNVKPDRPYYLPAQSPSVEINVAYLFGKPVPRAAVRVARREDRSWNYKTQRWEVEDGETISGTADELGNFRATLDIKDEFTKLGDEDYYRDLTYTAYATDPSTGRTEQRRFDVRATNSQIHIYFTPVGFTSSALPPEYFVTTSYADGSPISCEVEIRAQEDTASGEQVLANLHTNRFGVARVRDNAPLRFDHELALTFVAKDRRGISGLHKENRWSRDRSRFLRVTTRKTILRPNEPIEAEIESDSDGEVIVELADRRRVFRNFTVRLRHRRAFVTIPYRPEFSGQLDLAVMAMQRGERWDPYLLKANRSVIYPQDDSVKLAVRLDRPEYQPGQSAAATVQVRSSAGLPIPSAIGAVVFDQAVEERARVAEELREPFGLGYFYHPDWGSSTNLAALSRSDLDRIDLRDDIPEDLDLAADFILNAGSYSYGAHSQIFASSGDSRSLGQIYRGELNTRLRPVQLALDEERGSNSVIPRNAKQFDDFVQRQHLSQWLVDPWGSQLVPGFDIGWHDYEITLTSIGPDKTRNTEDDFIVETYTSPFYMATQRLVTRAIIEHHRRTSRYVRDLPALNEALAMIGTKASNLVDPWERPYIFSFEIQGAQYVVVGNSLGPDSRHPEEHAVGASGIDFFTDERRAIDDVFAAKMSQRVNLPASPDEFKAMLLPDIRFDDMRDPYGRPYSIRISEIARYSDRQSQTDQKVTSEPITIRNRLFTIRSLGKDALPDTSDDCEVANFSVEFSEMNASGMSSVPRFRTPFTGDTGAITGVVLDESGAVIARAPVIAINTVTRVQYPTFTVDDGTYVLRNLPAGVYDLSFLAAGFQKRVIRGFLVSAQQSIYVSATLRAGSTAETIEVVSEAAVVQTESSMLSVSIPAPPPPPPHGHALQTQSITPRLRQYFPETLLWQPSIETDSRGRARIDWKFADNITTWKLSLIASTLDGRITTAEKEVTSFQPFFVEHDPPKVLTSGDRITLPVVLRNYTDKAARVKVELAPESWFRADATLLREAELTPGGNARVTFPFEAIASTAAGKQRVTATSSSVADAIERQVSVHPHGAELTSSEGRILGSAALWDFDIPAEAIPGSVRTDLKIYPDLLAQVTESVEGMLQRPYGCGEQTLSSTYPSVLLLRFEKESHRSLGPMHDRAQRFLSLGYTRLLTYSDPSGGFTYWGHGDPDLALTAYAVRFLRDASPFIAVDPDLIKSAREWLFKQQQPDGLWVIKRRYYEDPISDLNLTAYVVRILAETRTSDPKQLDAENSAIRRALDKVAAGIQNFNDPYLFASYGLAGTAAGEPRRATDVLPSLVNGAQKDVSGTFWDLRANTPFHGWGRAGRVETTALTVQLLERAGRPQDRDLVDRGLGFVLSQKDRYGAWYSTQTTVNVIESLLLLAKREANMSDAPLRITVNGSPQSLALDSARPNTPQVVDISSLVRPGRNTIETTGGRTLASAQSVSFYHVRWDSTVVAPQPGPLKLDVACDRTRLEVGTKATCKVSAERVGTRGYGMMIAEIGIPPGVDVDRESLQNQLSTSGWDLSSFEVLPDRVIAYLWPRAGGTSFTLSFTPRMAIDAHSAPYILYDYYNPDAAITLPPTRFIVTEPAALTAD